MPHGTRIYNKLMNMIKAEYFERDYDEVITPNIFNLNSGAIGAPEFLRCPPLKGFARLRGQYRPTIPSATLQALGEVVLDVVQSSSSRSDGSASGNDLAVSF